MSFSACKSGTDYSEKTVAAKITKIKYSTVTVTLGEYTESENKQSNGQTPPQGNDNGNTASDQSNGNNSTNQNGNPPEKPSGDNSNSGDGQNGGQTPPEQPNGGAPMGNMGQSGTFTAGTETASFDISDATIIKNSDVAEIKDLSKCDDENALRVDGSTVTLDGITVNKSAGATSNTQNGDFDGVNAALLASNKSTVTIKNSKISSSAQNGTAVSDNAVITIEKGSVWNLTGDCTVTSVTNKGKINFNGCKITLSDGTVLK